MAYLWVFMVLVAAQEQAINNRNYQEVMWPASGEHIYTDCVRNIRRQRTILYLDVRYSLKQSTSSGTIMLH